MDSLSSTLSNLGIPATYDLLVMYDFYADALVWIKNPSGHYCWANQTLLLNFTIEDLRDLIGKTDYDLVPMTLAGIERGMRALGR